MHTRLSVPNFVWRGDERHVDTLDLSDPAARTQALAAASGQFGIHQALPSGEHVLARDALGVNKLFFALAPDGAVETSNYWFELVERGRDPETVWSVPSGHVTVVAPERRELTLTQYADLAFGGGDADRTDDGRSLATHARRIGRRLERTFRRIRDVSAGRPLYVSLSGGLDSTTIAVLARELLGEFTAVTFAVDDGGPASEDLAFATRVAADIGVRLETVIVTPDDVLSLLDTALVFGQDWRDFNVHCALVNAAIGRAIGGRHVAGDGHGDPPLLLTGDVMNELVADYTPVAYGGEVHYRLPRLSPSRLRRVLVAGLDAGDREVGVLRHYGVGVVQPYAMCADAYAALPPSIVESPHAKQRLVEAVMGDRVPRYVYDRPKTRAQAGGSEEIRGTLSVLVDHGIDAGWLERRFAELAGVDPAWLPRLVRGGRYRSTSTYPARD